MLKLNVTTFDDCYRACVAMMIGEPDVKSLPHFARIAVEIGSFSVAVARPWLIERGYGLVQVPYMGNYSFENILASLHTQCGTSPAILSGMTAAGMPHSIVIKSGAVWHNPGTGDVTPLQDPYTDEHLEHPVWIADFITVIPSTVH